MNRGILWGTRLAMCAPVMLTRDALSLDAPVFSFEERMLGDARRSVLLVEDDPDQRARYHRLLCRWGYDVTSVATSRHAERAVREGSVDVVVSDVMLSGDSGFELARGLRAACPDVPVVLMSAHAPAGAAREALGHGAFAFVPKTASAAALERAVYEALVRRALSTGVSPSSSDLAVQHLDADAEFVVALRLLWVAWQPVVHTRDARRSGYECFVRSNWPDLARPSALFRVASERGELRTFGRQIRREVGAALAQRPDIAQVFVNLHPEEILDDVLLTDAEPLAPHACRVVFELGNVASVDTRAELAPRVRALRARGFRVAIDDVVSGCAAPDERWSVEHDVVKVNLTVARSLVRPDRLERYLRILCVMTHSYGAAVVVEGVESADERAMALSAGADYLQGHLLGRPSLLPAPELR